MSDIYQWASPSCSPPVRQLVPRIPTENKKEMWTAGYVAITRAPNLYEMIDEVDMNDFPTYNLQPKYIKTHGMVLW